MTASTAQSAPRTGQADAIDPRHAWMLGIVVDDDGSLRPAPSAGDPRFGALRPDLPHDELPTCTCPDYCELDHEVEPS